MKIKRIQLDKFKRFTHLTIDNLPPTAKLIVMVGPNGCGKSSVFDGFKAWHLFNAYRNGAGDDYCKKEIEDKRSSFNLVNIDFYDNIKDYSQQKFRQAFYFRTAYRNSPEITINVLQKIPSPLERADNRMMIHNDSTVDENYQRLISATLVEFFSEKNDEKIVKTLRDELIEHIREPLLRLFPDLLLTEIGIVTEKPEFYFNKGTTHRYGYEKLSGGEKAAFDLLLDFVVKNQYYKDTVFCIDEPEAHIHTSLQARLLSELFNLVPSNSQLWIATHSFGMMKEARHLSEQHPDEVVFLNFDGYDFDEPAVITPSSCNSAIWRKMLEISLDEYATYISPETVVFCEGSSQGRKRRDFDARCYENIFGGELSGTMFYSMGNCEDVEKEKKEVDYIGRISPTTRIIKLIDRDNRSPEEISDLEREGVRVLSRRHIESYLLDDEVLKKWCAVVGKVDKEKDLLEIKQRAIAESVRRGNDSNDIKSAANTICDKGRKLLSAVDCGNNGEMIMRDTISKLITPDMDVYKTLKRDIFD